MDLRIEDVDAVELLGVPVLIQRYHAEGRVYEVQRKATGPDDGEFEKRWNAVLERVEDVVEPWSISSWLTDPTSEAMAGTPEIFAFVYEDRGGLPGDEGDEDDYLSIEYDLDQNCYRVEVPDAEHPAVDGLTAPTLREALERGVFAWHEALHHSDTGA